MAHIGQQICRKKSSVHAPEIKYRSLSLPLLIAPPKAHRQHGIKLAVMQLLFVALLIASPCTMQHIPGIQARHSTRDQLKNGTSQGTITRTNR